MNRLIADLYAEESAQRLKAVRAIGRMKWDGAEAAPYLASMLRDTDAKVAMAAAKALAEMGPKACEAVLSLAEVAADHTLPNKLRVAAVWSLSAVGPKAEPAIAAMAELLKNGPTWIRYPCA